MNGSNAIGANTRSNRTFSQELHVVPAWAWIFGVLLFFCMSVFMIWIAPNLPSQHNPPPYWIRIWLGPLLGIVLFCWFALVGYVNRDSGPRGMSRVAWTLLALFVPNGLGFILYFLLRHPLQEPCPSCGAQVESGFNFCPKCDTKLHPHCAQCQRSVRLTDKFCPYCGYELDKITPVTSR